MEKNKSLDIENYKDNPGSFNLLPSATTRATEAKRPSRALLECTISSLSRYDDNVGMIMMERICGPIYMTVETTHRCGAITWDTGLCTVAIVTLLSY